MRNEELGMRNEESSLIRNEELGMRNEELGMRMTYIRLDFGLFIYLTNGFTEQSFPSVIWHFRVW
jgi:hypothetical protein